MNREDISIEEWTIEEFCNNHVACQDGREWALEYCVSMQDAWEKLPPEYLVWVACRKDVLTYQELRLFTRFCCREKWGQLTDPKSIAVVDVADRYANGEARIPELKEAILAVNGYIQPWISSVPQMAMAASLITKVGEDCEVYIIETKQAAWLRAHITPNFKREVK